MIVLDTTIVNVALPSIQADLGFTETSLVWVVNAYLLTFGGFLLLGGRLGDLFGQRAAVPHRHRAVHGGVARLRPGDVAGDADRRAGGTGRRRRGGLGGGAVADHEPVHRAGRAREGDGHLRLRHGRRRQRRRAARRRAHRRRSTGTGSSWSTCRSALVGARALRCGCCRGDSAAERPRRLDVAGAVTVTAALLLAVYAVVNGDAGRLDVGADARAARRRGGAAAALPRASRRGSQAPLVPLGLFRLRNLSIANVVGVLWAAAMFAWFFLSALYMQLVLGYTPLQVGLAFLPSNLIMGAFSLGLSAKLVMRFGIRRPLARRPCARRGRTGAVRAGAGRRRSSCSTCCRACCCSASAPASRSTRCCWRR